MSPETTTIAPDRAFGQLASDERIARTAAALEANGIHALIAENGEEAKRMFFELLPDGAEVFLGASVTLEALGIKDVIDKSGVLRRPGKDRDAVERPTGGDEPAAAPPPSCRLEADQVMEGGRDAARSRGVGAERESDQPG